MQAKHPANIKKVTHKPRFEFYSILSQSSNDTVSENLENQYSLQVAAIKKSEDANKLRAQLLLLGFDVHIEKVVHGQEIWHRVSLGPFKDLVAAQKAKAQLKDNHFDGILRRVESHG